MIRRLGVKKAKRGFTLMELLIAMTVFLIVVSLSSGIFLQTIRSQRAVTQLSENVNNVTLSLEQIAREVRTGFDFPISGEGSGEFEALKFRNGYGNYVSYALVGEGLIGRCESFQEADCQITADLSDFEPITSPDVEVESLRFFVQNDIYEPPLVTIAAGVSIAQSATLTLQTSVSARVID